jgi:4-amino-4-deoxy-L-arabinose transferase-like glycosyltransferase
MSQRTKVLILQLAVVVGVCSFLFYFGLGAFGLVGADEPRYAQIAREMFARHDWIVPTLNGQPWLEKPVLLYWKMMNSYAVFGVSDWAARVPSATYALGLVLVIFFFVRRFRPGAELKAALITASSAAVIAFGRAASTDMMLSAPFAEAMLAWWAWHETGRKLWLGFFYALLAVGALAKGPVAPAFAVLIVGLYALARRDKKIFTNSLWWPGFLLFFAIALPWYIAIQVKVPHFLRFFFLEQNLERFGTNIYHHTQPFWYYIPVFLLSMVPWTLFTIAALIEAGKDGIRRWRMNGQAGSNSEWLEIFLLIWIVVPIIFFSISRSKLPGYILPSIPAAAVLTADYLHRRGELNRWMFRLHSLICGGLVAGALLAPLLMLKVPLSKAPINAAVLAAATMAIMVLLLVGRGGARMLYLATLVPVMVAAGFLLWPAAPVIDDVNSARAVNMTLAELGARSGPVSVLNVKREIEYGLNFYRNQPISRYERDGVPPEAHVLVAREGNDETVQAKVGQRQITKLWNFAPQHLDIFLVSKKETGLP